jgi:hypothetical protein
MKPTFVVGVLRSSTTSQAHLGKSKKRFRSSLSKTGGESYIFASVELKILMTVDIASPPCPKNERFWDD